MIGSSINQPAKKGGAGGSYTWGSALDGQDFLPVGFDAANVGLVTNSGYAPTVTYAQAAPAQAFQYQQQAFPKLGQTANKVVNSSWGSTSVGPQVLAATSLRTGALETVGQQQPRNQFAKKPYMSQRTASVQVANTAQAGMIDWSQAGLAQGVVQSIVQSNAAAAHLGPFGSQPVSQVPLTALRAQNVGTQQAYTQQKEQVAKMPVKNARTISGGIKQPQ